MMVSRISFTITTDVRELPSRFAATLAVRVPLPWPDVGLIASHEVLLTTVQRHSRSVAIPTGNTDSDAGSDPPGALTVIRQRASVGAVISSTTVRPHPTHTGSRIRVRSLQWPGRRITAAVMHVRRQ